MKIWIPLAALTFLTACDKAEEKPQASVVPAPKPTPRPKPAVTAPPVAEVPALPAAVAPAVPATAEEIEAFNAKLEAFRALSVPFLKAAGGEIPEAEVKAMRESFNDLMKSRSKLAVGLTAEQKKELGQRCLPLIPQVSVALRKQEAPKLPDGSPASDDPLSVLEANPLPGAAPDPADAAGPGGRRRVVPVEPQPETAPAQ